MRDFRLYLRDIYDAMVAILEFVGEMDYDAFVADDKTAAAVIRKFEIIGEASKNVPEEVRQKYALVPWRRMAGMRDRLIHAYFGVDYSLVWQTAKEEILRFSPSSKRSFEPQRKRKHCELELSFSPFTTVFTLQ